jgi:hypothetical protein
MSWQVSYCLACDRTLLFNIDLCNLGIPGFCEQILLDLLRQDKIYIIEKNDNDDNDDENFVDGDRDQLCVVEYDDRHEPIGLGRTLFSRTKTSSIVHVHRSSQQVLSRVCRLRDPTSNDIDADCQSNFRNYLMCRIDRLSEGESLLIKIAAVIGMTFSRIFLWQLVDRSSRKLINMNASIFDMMQRTVLECAYQHGRQRQRSIRCFCLQNPAGFPYQCRLMAFTHQSIREGILHSLTDSLKRMLTCHAIDYLEQQCTIVCRTCRSTNDEYPFFISKYDNRTLMIERTTCQTRFVDVVQMAALNDIDRVIKQMNKVRSTTARSTSYVQLTSINSSMDNNHVK